MVKLGTGKYPKNIRFSFGSGSDSDSSDSSGNITQTIQNEPKQPESIRKLVYLLPSGN